MSDEDNALHEKPLEFFASISSVGTDCGGQAILPEGSHFRAWCTCGLWSVETDTSGEGLRLARLHTQGSTG
ncbi:hypothetical protein MANY_03470 [Mycolicibacterium anyangense]|jgi:hypothetical protein|uniref:Uncharacterized protein n=1 Tax=Mycolicibacterium anyangense TaxID=1431246 RepID=A0A6N4VZF3_9MYCO|nr:hypothetical protein MANY_03470 [Mycolicibacterium anyangense]